MLAVAAGWATDFVWTGNTSLAEDWFDSANWEVNGAATDTYPQAGDTATFNKAASLNVGDEITVGTLVLNADLTHKRDKWLTVGGVSGTGKLILTNRGRLRNVSGTPFDFRTTHPVGEHHDDDYAELTYGMQPRQHADDTGEREYIQSFRQTAW